MQHAPRLLQVDAEYITLNTNNNNYKSTYDGLLCFLAVPMVVLLTCKDTLSFIETTSPRSQPS